MIGYTNRKTQSFPMKIGLTDELLTLYVVYACVSASKRGQRKIKIIRRKKSEHPSDTPSSDRALSAPRNPSGVPAPRRLRP